MNDRKNLVTAGAGIAKSNLRYIIWFYGLNLLFAWLGTSGLATRAHNVMDRSLYSDKLLHGFDLSVWVELINRPDFKPMLSLTVPAMIFAALFLGASLLFMPGVLLGYSSDHRISRDEFFRGCGHNLWRFVRLFVMAAVLAGAISSGLMAALDALSKAAEKTNYERLPFFTEVGGWVVMILILTIIRMWFDLAQTDVVLRDQAAARKAVAAAFRIMGRNFGRLFGSYVLITVAAVAVLASGIVLWNLIVPPSSVLGGFLIGQFTMFLLLASRFWQRAAAVACYLKQAEPAMEMAPIQAAVAAVS